MELISVGGKARYKKAGQLLCCGSFNDQFADADIRNYVGNVWYQREVFIPKGWAGQRIVLRFDAVTHYGKVWVNNQEVMEHQGGYTPFEADVTPYVIAGKSVSPFV